MADKIESNWIIGDYIEVEQPDSDGDITIAISHYNKLGKIALNKDQANELIDNIRTAIAKATK